MNSFTFAYALQLLAWAIVGAAVQGVVLAVNWRSESNPDCELEHRASCLRMATLLVGLISTGIIIQVTLVLGAETRASPPPDLPTLLIAEHGLPSLTSCILGLWITGLAVMLGRLGIEAARLAYMPLDRAPTSIHQAVGRLAPDVFIAVKAASLSSPQVVGLFRPLLIVPHGFGEGLSTPEMDAILLHEIAHVRRRDFAWNILQRLALAVLWFQPAAWSTYRRIALTREACCDGLAVRQGADPAKLARALIALAAREASRRTSPAMALHGADKTPGDLTRRVLALVDTCSGQRKAESARVGRIGPRLTRGIVLSAVLIAPAYTASHDARVNGLFLASDFGPTISIEARDAAGAFSVQVRQGRLIGASVDGRPLSADQVLQSGREVQLLAVGQEPLTITVAPHAAIEWRGRPPSLPLPETAMR